MQIFSYHAWNSPPQIAYKNNIPALSPSILWKKGYTPLMRASQQGNLGATKALVAAGADLNAKSEVSKTLRQRAAIYTLFSM